MAVTTQSPEALAEICSAELVRRGFIVIPGFLTDDEVEAGRASFARLVPTPDEYFANGSAKYAVMQPAPPGRFGGGGLCRFPHFDDDVLVDHVISPRIATLVGHILGTSDVRCDIAGLFVKYAGFGEYDQELHRDGLGMAYHHMDGIHRVLSCWLYYSDITEDCGPMHLLPREHAEVLPPATRHLPRDKYPEVYEREVTAVGPAGSLLIFINPGVFHRGSALGPPPAHRWVTGSSYRAAVNESPNLGRWNRYLEEPAVKRFLTRATPGQRTLAGFPAPGDPYWDEYTLAGVEAMYPGIDLSAYRT